MRQRSSKIRLCSKIFKLKNYYGRCLKKGRKLEIDPSLIKAIYRYVRLKNKDTIIVVD
jgi:CRISPR/Cas system endoribonuclease Cas6 (RAMP superfamily)